MPVPLPFQWVFGESLSDRLSCVGLLQCHLSAMVLKGDGNFLLCSMAIECTLDVQSLYLIELAMGSTQILIFPTFAAMVFAYRILYSDRKAWVGLGLSVYRAGVIGIMRIFCLSFLSLSAYSIVEIQGYWNV